MAVHIEDSVVFHVPLAVHIEVVCVCVRHGTLGTGTSAVLHAHFLVGGL